MPETPPPHGVTLFDHAKIAAKVAENDRPTADVLAEHELTEAQWNESTTYWMGRMADDVTQHGIEAKVPTTYSDAFGKAQDAIKPVPPMTPEEWATLTVEVQQSGGPARPLAARNLSIPDYLRLARHWARVLSSVPAQNRRFFATYEALQPPSPLV
jgi:hypothetical protein